MTWSGACRGGGASGRGTLVWTRDGKSTEQTGALTRGRKQGEWKAVYSGGSIYQATYVNGKVNGRYVWKYKGGKDDVACSDPDLKTGYLREQTIEETGTRVNGSKEGQAKRRYCRIGFRNNNQVYYVIVEEGPYNNNKKHGKWVERGEDGDVREGTYENGEKHGRWVERSVGKYGSVREGTYENGKMDGRWVVRHNDGSYINESVCENGKCKNHGRYFRRLESGTTFGGQYVDGEKHGRWTSRYADGSCSTVRYDRGKMVKDTWSKC